LQYEQPMKVIVTCGPSYEPFDRVRRLTNSSIMEFCFACQYITE